MATEASKLNVPVISDGTPMWPSQLVQSVGSFEAAGNKVVVTVTV